MLERWGPHAADLLTATRVLLTPFFVLCVWLAEQSRWFGVVAVGIFAVIAASDFFDGRLARRWYRDSSRGRVFDHFADIGFLVAALTAYVGVGLAPWWVPAAVAGAFAFYVFDSRQRRARAATADAPTTALTLIGSRLGHSGGVCNYVLVGVLVCNNSARIHLLSAGFLSLLFCLVPLYSGGAVAARVLSRRPPLSTVELADTRQ